VKHVKRACDILAQKILDDGSARVAVDPVGDVVPTGLVDDRLGHACPA
jgi:hypothetical protein